MQQNYAFIDAQNLNSGLSKLGWKIDWKRFREYLRTVAWIEVAYVFLWFIPGNQDLYLMLQKSGFVVVFKEILTTESWEIKGNIDAEMILQAMIDYDRYDQALIVSGDGDFTCLLRYLEQNHKLLWILAPYEKGLSSLIQKLAWNKIEYLRALRKQIEYRPVRTTRAHNDPMPPMKQENYTNNIVPLSSKQTKTPSENIKKQKNEAAPHIKEKQQQTIKIPTTQDLSVSKSSPKKWTLYTGSSLT